MTVLSNIPRSLSKDALRSYGSLSKSYFNAKHDLWIEKDLFNEAASREMEGFSDFIAWHYAFSMRRDS